MSDFEDAVHRVIASLEPGEVMSYGEVAAEAGFPGAARAVGNYLRTSEGLPWWRVVPASGKLATDRVHRQGERLRAEGVTVRNGRVIR